MIKISDKTKYSALMWLLIAVGAYLLDKGQNGNNIAVTQFFGAVIIFCAGITAVLAKDRD